MSEEILSEVVEELEPVVEEAVVEEEVAEEPAVEEEVAEEQEVPVDAVPLAKYMSEKKKRQELERMLHEKLATEENNKRTYTLAQDYIQRGYPDTEAYRLAYDTVTKEAEQRKAQEKYETKLFDIELKELAKTDAFFSDAVTYRDEIKDKMRKFDCSVQDAYMLVRGPSRQREWITQQEQRAKVKPAQKKVETSSAQPMKSKYPLDADDRRALAELQKMQPEAAWTAEKFYKMTKG